MKADDQNLKNVVTDAENGGAYDADRETALREMLVSSFRGQLKWGTLITWGCMAVFAAIAVVAGVQFFVVPGVREMILWATIFAVAMGMICVVKLWYWMLVGRKATERELKRLELRVADLAQKVERK
jgi:hypothetical protein